MFLKKNFEKKSQQFLFPQTSPPPPPEKRAFCEVMLQIIVERGRPLMAIRRLRTSCWLTKATNKHSEYVILIAFPLQQWLRERASVFRSRCNAHPVPQSQIAHFALNLTVALLARVRKAPDMNAGLLTTCANEVPWFS